MKKKQCIALAMTMLMAIPTAAFVNAAPTPLTSTKTAVTAQQKNAYSLQVVGNKLSFVQNGKVVKEVTMSKSDLRLGKSKAGGLALTLTDASGKTVKFTLGSQTNLSISGNISSLQVDADAPAASNINLGENSTVNRVTVRGAAKVSTEANCKISTLSVTNPAAVFKGDKTTKIDRAFAASPTSITGSAAIADPVYERSTVDTTTDEDYTPSVTQPTTNTYDAPVAPVAMDIASAMYTDRGTLQVTLTKATAQPLTKDAFSVLCEDGGKDMTIISVSTTDNRTYILKTYYYKDSYYSLGVTLADNTLLTKRFSVRMDAPSIKDVATNRVNGTEATFSYFSDSTGTIYYKAVAETVSSLSVNNSVKPFSTEPTDDELLAGSSSAMTYGSNTVSLSGLTENTPYTIYYMAVDDFEKRTSIFSTSLDAVGEEAVNASDVKITKVAGGSLKTYGYFTITFSAPVPGLTASDFEVKCPSDGFMSLGTAVSDDGGLTYTLNMPKYYFFKSNNTYAVTATLTDGKTATGSGYIDAEGPILLGLDYEWTAEGTIRAELRSNEPGTLYYTILDYMPTTVIPDGTVLLPEEQFQFSPDMQLLYQSTNSAAMNYGSTYFDVSNMTAGKYLCVVAEDKEGNKTTAHYSKKITGKYTAPADPTNVLSITNVVGERDGSGVTLTITFNKAINTYAIASMDNAISISGVSGRMGWNADSTSMSATSLTVFSPYNGSLLTAGEKTLTFKADEGTAQFTFTMP